MPNFLVYFVHRHFEFRYPELAALLELQGLSLDECVSPADRPEPASSPLLHIELPSRNHATFLSARGILVKGVYEVWGRAADTGEYGELVASVAAFAGVDKQRIISDKHCSWRINVDAFGKKLSMDEQTARRERFREVLPFAGPVQMREPDETFLVLEEFAVDQDQRPEQPPKQLLLLREVAGSERNRGRGGGRDLVDQQTLKRRAYIGPTSMESEMALLMSNMALVRRGDLVIDPFVGTGSVLVPCATHGAVCYGTDIDIRVLLGTGVGVSGKPVDPPVSSQGQDAARVNVVSNFKQYGLPLPELVRGDNSRSPLVERSAGLFDAVVCDPPYGIRAGARKSGRKRSKKSESEPAESVRDKTKQPNYIPPTQPYAAEDVMRDLLEFAARVLRDGGRLVYLLPTTYEYTDADLPRHPLLRVVSNSEQKLTLKYARRLITMVKLAEAQSGDEQRSASPVVADGSASFANLRDKIRKRKPDADLEG